jgi:serine/threonine protein kinase
MSDVASVEGADSEELVGRIADEFTDRVNRGETPDVEEYAQRYPQIADVLRVILPPIPILRRSGGRSEAPCNAAGPDRADTLGEYRIVREVGRGGMGIVYEAVQRSLGRRVALKALPTHAVLNPKLRLRFEREARAAARLHHTNIVPVFGVGEQDGIHFYVMQFIEGQGLDRVLWKLRMLRTSGNGSPPSAPSAGQQSGANQEFLAVSIAQSLLTNNTPAQGGDVIRSSPVPSSGSIRRRRADCPMARAISRIFMLWLVSAYKLPMHFPMHIPWEYFIAILNPPICCWIRTDPFG